MFCGSRSDFWIEVALGEQCGWIANCVSDLCQILKAKGYLIKNALADDLVKSIETVSNGEVFLSSEIAKKMAMQSISGNQDPVHDLSAREFEIFRLLAEGFDIDAIASTLNISSKTVSNYQTMIKQKLNINTPIELIRYAIKAGVIKN